MVDDLLDVSRINTGKVELRLSPTLLAEIIRDAVAACRPQIEAARHRLVVTVPDEDIYLQADAGRLVQVVVNLLSNAVKFTDAGGEIRLSATRDGEQAAICVQDTGAGIPAESLPHIFDMFAQVEDPYRRSRGGLGLGLNIVRTLVELHGGKAEARSHGRGRGAEFIVRLPVLNNHFPSAVETRRSHSAQLGHPSSQRVLVVDDNRDAASTLTIMLTKAGFVCRSVFDGPSALAAAADFDPHVVILDLGMPGMNGLEVARQFRAQENHNGLVLIAVTGWDKQDDRRLTKEAGFDHHLAKPVPFEQLRTLLGPSARPPL
jgi:CheY-like chemotaxis protein